MPYVPKNRIQTNLYTAGGEFYIPNINFNYVGYYYTLYTGKSFSGKNPNDTPNYRLFPLERANTDSISNVSVIYTEDNSNYNNLKKINTSKTISFPQLFYTKPTENDYNLGEFQRYFCKKRNEFIYLEISKSDYDKLVDKNSTIDYKNWNAFTIPWELTGEKGKVYNTNRNIVLLEEKNKKFYGFGKYLREDYLRYYKP